MRALLLAALAALSPARGAPSPADAETARLAAQGYRPGASARARLKDGEVRAVVYSKEDGSQRLYIYRREGASLKTLHMELGGSQHIELASIHEGGALPDLAGDGSRVIAYRTILPRLDQDQLSVMLWRAGRLEKLGRVPGGRFEDVDGDGRLEVVGRERPLGALFSLSCSSFHTMAQAAWRTSVHSLRQGRLVKTSESHRPFFDRRISDTKSRIAGIDARSTEDYGGFLGLTLSLYFDYAESGRGREGWKEFEGSYPVRASDPGPVKRCLTQMRDEIRSRLDIPDEWASRP
ncbi:MAG: hypothetical protein HY928_11620 [Elusimicrobia bacterium]|nr:hypothetical protein [Elusimicrobiota bacterium]